MFIHGHQPSILTTSTARRLPRKKVRGPSVQAPAERFTPSDTTLSEPKKKGGGFSKKNLAYLMLGLAAVPLVGTMLASASHSTASVKSSEPAVTAVAPTPEPSNINIELGPSGTLVQFDEPSPAITEFQAPVTANQAQAPTITLHPIEQGPGLIPPAGSRVTTSTVAPTPETTVPPTPEQTPEPEVNGAQVSAEASRSAEGPVQVSPVEPPPTTVAPQPSKTEQFIDFALQQQGADYLYGAEGPDKFDCSGLIHYSLQHMGVEGRRMAAREYQSKYAEHAIEQGDQLQPGDLVFFHSPNDRGIPEGRATHIEIYLGDGMTMGAGPIGGAAVEPINWDTFIGGARIPDFQN